MSHQVIRSFDSLEAMGKFIDSGARGEPIDEVPFRDERGEPMTGEQVLELARQIELETGRRLVFRSGERPRAA